MVFFSVIYPQPIWRLENMNMDERRVDAVANTPPVRELYESGAIGIDQSVWSMDGPHPQYAQLNEDIETDIVVVGAGVAGAALSLHLAELGVRTVLLEAAQPADAASGRNAGHVQPYLLSLDPLAALPGKGQPFLDLLIEHRRIVYDLCARYGIEADQVNAGLLDVARQRSAAMEKKAQRWRELGLEVDCLGGSEVKDLVGSDRYQFGVIWRDGGMVNPFLFTNGMVTAAANLGVRVFGNSAVLDCERQPGGGWKLRAGKGSVRAQRVVLCTNGHVGARFFPHLARTQYPLLACALATRPLPQEFVELINPTRAAVSQYPAGLFPMVIDRHRRLITATIPSMGKAADPQLYFNYLLRHLHRAYPQTQQMKIELETYWTGMTHNSSSDYAAAYPKFYHVDDGVFALMNFGSWGNFLAPLLGLNVAQALAQDQPEKAVVGLEQASSVRFQNAFSTKLRRVLIPLARLGDRFDRV